MHISSSPSQFDFAFPCVSYWIFICTLILHSLSDLCILLPCKPFSPVPSCINYQYCVFMLQLLDFLPQNFSSSLFCFPISSLCHSLACSLQANALQLFLSPSHLICCWPFYFVFKICMLINCIFLRLVLLGILNRPQSFFQSIRSCLP